MSIFDKIRDIFKPKKPWGDSSRLAGEDYPKPSTPVRDTGSKWTKGDSSRLAGEDYPKPSTPVRDTGSKGATSRTTSQKQVIQEIPESSEIVGSRETISQRKSSVTPAYETTQLETQVYLRDNKVGYQGTNYTGSQRIPDVNLTAKDIQTQARDYLKSEDVKESEVDYVVVDYGKKYTPTTAKVQRNSFYFDEGTIKDKPEGAESLSSENVILKKDSQFLVPSTYATGSTSRTGTGSTMETKPYVPYKLDTSPSNESNSLKTNENSVVWKVDKSPTLRERYLESTQRAGYVQGTLNFLGSEASNLIDVRRQDQLQKGNLGYQWTSVSKAVEISPNIVKFIPTTAPFFLVAQGGEELITPAGRGRTAERTAYLESTGLDPKVAKQLSYAVPISQIALGGGVLTMNYLRTGRLIGYTPRQQDRISNLLKKDGVIKRDVIGSNTQVRDYFVRNGQKSSNLASSSKITQYKITTDKTGLGFSDKLLLNKLNLRGSEFEKVTQVGKNAFGTSASVVKTGGIIGKKTNILSEFQGGINAGKFTGVRYSILETGKQGQLIKEFISGKGSTSNIGDFRLDSSFGQGVQVASFGYKVTPDTINVNSFDLRTPITISKSSTLSFLRSGKLDVKPIGSNSYGISSVKDYKGLAGTISSSKTYPSFYLDKASSTASRVMKPFEDVVSQQGSSSLLITKTSASVPSISSTALKSIDIGQGVSGIAPSVYAGMGQYEQTAFSSVLSPNSGKGSLVLDSGSISPTFKNAEIKLSPVIKGVKSNVSQKKSSKVSQIIKPQDKVIEKNILKQDAILSPKTRVSQRVDILQGQREKTLLRRAIQGLRTIQKPTTTNNSIVPVGGFGFGLGGGTKTEDKRVKDSFGVFVKKFGKDIKLGEFETLQQAKGKLLGELKTTLRAGGYITKDDEPIKFEKLGIFNGQFRKSKVDPFRVVQRKTKRLSSPLETGDIIGFRKSSSSKKKSKSVWGL